MREYPSVYHLFKDQFCRIGICEYDGECEDCWAGDIRKQAAKDIDRIHELEKEVKALKATMSECHDFFILRDANGAPVQIDCGGKTYDCVPVVKEQS